MSHVGWEFYLSHHFILFPSHIGLLPINVAIVHREVFEIETVSVGKTNRGIPVGIGDSHKLNRFCNV